MIRKYSAKGITYGDVLLVPMLSGITSRLSNEIDLSTEIFKGYKIKYPVISSPMSCTTDKHFALKMITLGCQGIVHRFQNKSEQIFDLDSIPDGFKSMAGELFEHNMYTNKDLICAIGINENDRVEYLYKNGVRMFCLDVANGGNTIVGDEIKKIKDEYSDIKLMAGNVVTGETAYYLVQCGVDSLRVGMGQGSVCSSRIVTGCGMPSLTGIQLVKEGVGNTVPIVADGGITTSGDVVKSLAFGADAVMCGRLFASFSECGDIIKKDNQCYKLYLGQASRRFQEQNNKLKRGTAPEGIDTMIPMRYDLSLSEYIDEFIGGIRSACTYLNARTLDNLRSVCYLEISEASRIEGLPKL